MIEQSLHLRRNLNNYEKTYSLLVIITPILVTLYSIATKMVFQIHFATLILFIICYCATVLGVTLGFHRMLTHRSFKANRVTKIILVSLGCMSYEGPPIFWIAAHRRHHKYTDEEYDPHSPLNQNSKWIGLFHAHIGWMWSHQLEDWRHYGSDLLADKDVHFLNQYYIFIALLGLILPGVINGLIYLSWYQFYVGIIICGFVRVFLQQHVTWSINSICHVWGKRDFESADNSKNNWLFAVLALGEGWHNGHHAFPASACHGLKKGQIDVSYEVIKFLSYLGCISDVKIPKPSQVNDKLIIKET